MHHITAICLNSPFKSNQVTFSVPALLASFEARVMSLRKHKVCSLFTFPVLAHFPEKSFIPLWFLRMKVITPICLLIAYHQNPSRHIPSSTWLILVSICFLWCAVLHRGPRGKELMSPATNQQGPKVRCCRMQCEFLMGYWLGHSSYRRYFGANWEIWILTGIR